MTCKTKYKLIGAFRFYNWILSICGVLICFFAGCIGYYYAYSYGFFDALSNLAATSFQIVYGKIGIVIYGLLPLSLFLIGMTVFIILEKLGCYNFRKSPEQKLNLIIELAPMLGIVGTMVSLSNAMLQVDISKGVQHAIHHLTALVGQALNSSVFGIVLAMAAYLAKSFLYAKWKGQVK